MKRLRAVTCAAFLLTVIFSTAVLAAPPPPVAHTAPKPATKAEPAMRGQQKVVLTEQRGTALEADARAAIARDLAGADKAGDDPLLLVGTAKLGAVKDRPALFVQVQSARECGSAGCNTSVHVFRDRRWQRVVDTVSGPIVVDTQRHGGMRDLIVNGSDRWVWNGRAYVNSRPAPPPPVSLQKKKPVTAS
jgi:hypothetical protein